jgi:hypothetical protein
MWNVVPHRVIRPAASDECQAVHADNGRNSRGVCGERYDPLFPHDVAVERNPIRC